MYRTNTYHGKFASARIDLDLDSIFEESSTRARLRKSVTFIVGAPES